MKLAFLLLTILLSFSAVAGNVGLEYLGMISVNSSTSFETLRLYSCRERFKAVHQIKFKAIFTNIDFYGVRAEMEDLTYQILPGLWRLRRDMETDWIDLEGDQPCLKSIQLTIHGDSNFGYLEVWGLTERIVVN